MYVPEHFSETRTDVIAELLRASPFATLVTTGSDGLFATHLPLLFDPHGGERGVLRGHMARANPHWKRGAASSLAIFVGAQGYVSPSFYPSKAEHGKVVPTWNYTAVHVTGEVTFIDDADFTRRTVEDLTALMEAGRAPPWQVGDAPASFIEQAVQGIVGVQMTVSRIEAKLKLSQNRSTADFEGVLKGLSAERHCPASMTAEAMARLARPRRIR